MSFSVDCSSLIIQQQDLFACSKVLHEEFYWKCSVHKQNNKSILGLKALFVINYFVNRMK